MIQVGHLTQKAHPILVFFVFSCIIITIGLLYVVQKSEAKANNLSSISNSKDYYASPDDF